MKKAFTPSSRNSELSYFQNKTYYKLLMNCTFMVLSLLSLSSYGQVSGTVFRDFNGNGVKDNSSTFNEIFVQGVTVKAYDASGALVGTTTSGTTGAYSFTGLTLPLRIEFSALQTADYSAPVGSGNNTSVQFYTAASTTANFGVNYPNDYCQTNPALAFSCYVGGTLSGTGAADAAFVKITNTGYDKYIGQAGYTMPTIVADHQHLGAVYGNAYDRINKKIYTSAVLRRHVVFGPLGIGGIYQIDAATNAVTSWLDIETLAGIDAGTDTRDATPANSIPTDATKKSYDYLAFGLIGKQSLGDLDISDDGKTLYVVNLFQQSVVAIDVATKALVGTYPISASALGLTCPQSDFRSWGLEYYRGKLYVGAVCTAQTSQLATDLKGYVLAFDPANAGAGFSIYYSFALNYVRENGDNWKPWNQTSFDPGSSATDDARNPQAILSDIEFDVDGSMILGLMDRHGMMFSTGNGPPDPTATSTASTGAFTNADILRVCNTSTGFVLECTNNFPYSGGGEFYDDHRQLGGGTGQVKEVAGGALAFLPGSGEIVSTSIDEYDVFENGISWWNNKTGVRNRAYMVFDKNVTSTQGKTSGLGDIELLCNAAPIEIGNRVWNDADNDGIQDAGELGLSGVTVTLCLASAPSTPVATATTDSNGNYYFSSATGTTTPSAIYGVNLLFNTNYILKFPITNGGKNITTQNAGTDILINSDADAAGKIAFTTGSAGQNNHSFDVGYANVVACVKPNAGTDQAPTCVGSTAITTATLAATAVTGGAWTQVATNPAGAVVTTPTSATSGITGLTPGVYQFIWATSATCSDTVKITIPNCACVKPNAGTDQAPTCVGSTAITTATLAATAVTGGAWTQVATNPTGAIVTTPTSATSGITGLTPGVYQFIWATSATCSDTVKITIPNCACVKPNAGTDQAPTCVGTTAITTATLAATAVTGGAWTQVATNPTGAVVTTPTSATSGITGLTPGVYQFIWATSATCSDTVKITIPNCACIKPNAGTDQAPTCVGSTAITTATLAATAVTGGAWTQVATNPTGAVVTTPTSATSGITGLTPGVYQFIWATSASCSDTVKITIPNCSSCPITNYTICAGESYTLTAQAGLTGYQWYTISGVDTTAIAGATNQTYVATAIGSYIWKASDGTPCPIKLCCPVIIVAGKCYGSIGDYVWTDVNNDGQQGTTATEPPIAGVKVYLYDGTGTTKLDSTVTDASGKYLFDSLITGSYKVKFVAPKEMIAAKQNTGADVTDSDANKISGFSQVININTSLLTTDTLRNNPQIDAGFVPVGSISDYVFQDKDNSNTQTPGDLPIAGVKVYLLNGTTGAKLDSTVTDGNGLYLFDSLLASTYKVQFVVPIGSNLVTKTAGTDITKDSNPDPATGITDAITIDTSKPTGDPARDNRDIDAGIKASPAYGSIGDYVWTDKNNNGQQDSGEAPIAGVKVYLYEATGNTILDSTITDVSGKYLFDSLITAGYKVKFVAPTGTILAKQNIGPDVTDSDANGAGWSQVVNIDATKATTDTLRNNPQIDAGFVPVGSIGDYVFQDKDNSNTQTTGDLPIAGVKVYLLDGTTGAKLDSTVTDAAGKYLFDSLVAGNYKVQFIKPTGMLIVPAAQGGNTALDSNPDPTTGISPVVNIDTTLPIGNVGRDNPTIDAGLKGVPQYGSIGDYVWFDNNNDGQQGTAATEPPIAGVKVYLYDATGTTKLDSTVTDVNGKYLFDSLLTGGYKVKFVAPAGSIPAKQNIGADITDSDANKTGWSQVVNIDVTKLTTDTLRNNLQIDAGFVPFGSIGDYVFQDKDNSNTQTAGDVPIACIKVYLLDGTTGAILDSTMTDITGKYLFDSLLAGNYKVQFVKPQGVFIVTPTIGGDVTKDSNPDPTTGITSIVTIDPTKPVGDPARDNRDVDAGLKILGPFGSIGDYVWFDKNNNGQQDGTETPIKGVKVYLYDGTGTMILDSAITDINGKYLFDSLFTAQYKVKFVAPAGTISAKQNVGSDLTDNDANLAGWSQIISIDVTKLTTNTLRNNPQIDAGFVPFGSIGDYVFEDKDKSNTQTAGDAPIQGVKVYLLDGTTGAKLDSTVTDANGKYLFDSLVAGDYKIQFIKPVGTNIVTPSQGGNVALDSNPDPVTGITPTVTIDTTKPIGDPARDNRDVDAGIKPQLQYGSIGDFVWTDANNNGQQDGTEAPIAGVKVFLYDATGTNILDSTSTNASGKYLFDSLLTGSYKVKFIAPAGTIAAKQNVGADVTDSDANKAGWSQVVNIDVSQASTDTLRNNPQIDAGFVPVGSIGDYVFQDKDNSNTQTAGDLPISGVKVYLLDGTTGAKLDSTITNGLGKYLFDSLVAGNYKVQFIKPTGMLIVPASQGGNTTLDSNPDPTTGISPIVNIDTTLPNGNVGRDNPTVDAGLKGQPQYGSIGDYVWFDTNNDGQQGAIATEPVISGVKVYLYNGAGTTKLDSTVTDANGKYLFDSLVTVTGSYKVKFVAPVGTIAAKQNTGTDITDSDANKLGFSQVVNINTALVATDTLRNNPQIDAGFVPFGSLGDYVFNDTDASNTQTAGDTPVPNVKVYLLDGTTGAKLDSTFTNALGKYTFDSLLAGNYKVQFVIPVGQTIVTPAQGGDVAKDSNPNPATGITPNVTIDTTLPLGNVGRDNPTIDAGIVPTCVKPKVTATPNQIFCEGSIIGDMTVNVKSGNVVAQQWYGPLADTTSSLGTAISGATNAIFTPSGANLPPAGQKKYYAVVVSGGSASCADTAYVSLLISPKIVLTSKVTDALCNNGTGAITLTATGGTSPLSFLWDSGQTTQNLTSVPAGAYVVTVTDANKCIASLSQLITQPDSISIQITPTNVSCTGGSNGAIISSVSGGKQPFKYAWFNGATATGTPISTSATYTGLLAGTYTLLVTDSNSCTKAKTIKLTQPAPINISISKKDNICNGEKKGQIDLTIAGAATPFKGIIWTVDGVVNPAYNGLTSLTNLPAGNYSVSLIDANNCSVSVKDTIFQPKPMVVSASNTETICKGTKTGSISASVTGGTAPYIYSWSNGAADSTLTNLPGGTYKLIVTDAKKCKDSISVTIVEGICPVDIALTKKLLGDCEHKAGETVTFQIKVFRQDTLSVMAESIIVKDSLSDQMTYVSASSTKGTFNPATKLWSGLNLAKGDTATLTMQVLISSTFAGGLTCNEAWVESMTNPDIDSQPGDQNELEDDFARACVSVPLKLCPQRNEKILLTASPGFDSYQWYLDGTPIDGATNSTYLADTKGNYTVTINDSGKCTNSSCCPIIIQEDCPCLPNICVPFTVLKTKSSGK